MNSIFSFVRKRARHLSEDRVVVFEDDVVLCQGFADRLRLAVENLPHDWMVLYFGCVFRTTPGMVAPGLLRVTGPTWDMHGYMIRRPLWERVSQELAGASCRSRVDDPEGDSLLTEKSEAWWKLTPKERGRRRWDTACDVILAD